MSTPSNPGPLYREATSAHEGRESSTSVSRSSPWLARGVVALLALALVGWIGVRVKAATQAQKTVAEKRAADAKEAAETATRPRTGKVVRGAREQWQPQVPLEGSLAPLREADLGFKAAGRIGAIRVHVGEQVPAGALLASLETSEIAAQLTAAEAQARAAEAQLALAADAERRTSAMVATGAVAEANGVQTVNQKALAAAQVDAARAQVGLARVNLQNHSLTAPFAGVVTRVPAGPGAVVAPGAPQFHLSDLSVLKLTGTVGVDDAALVHPGQTVEMDVEGGKVTAKVTSVLGAVDLATRRVPVEVEVPNGASSQGGKSGKSPLLSGTFVRARVLGTQAIPVLRLPRDVVRPGAQDEVMIVKGGTLTARRLRYTVAPDGSLLVRDGLSDSEDVLLGPTAEAKDGDKVEVTP